MQVFFHFNLIQDLPKRIKYLGKDYVTYCNLISGLMDLTLQLLPDMQPGHVMQVLAAMVKLKLR